MTAPNVSKEKVAQLVLDEAQKIQEGPIRALLAEFGNLHNIDPQHNFFDAKQEVVADVGYFPGPKKKYALHLVNAEGVVVDEREDKGLIVRRSDYPQFTKEKVAELLALLVEAKSLSFSKVREHIDKTRGEIIELIELGDRQIARPVSFTKPLSQYSVMPMHIKGMLLFNEIEYNYFEPGVRGYMYRIRGIDQNLAPDHVRSRLPMVTIANNIVIPFEEDRLPEYYIIDKAAMLDFTWDDRVNELITPIKGKLGYKSDEMQGLTVTW